MWVMMSDAFLSIVEPTGKKPAKLLLVRARAQGDIERVFPNAVVTSPPGRDYRFRALIDRAEAAQAIAAEVMRISYGNFKDSVPAPDRHDAYLGCWQSMYRFQTQRVSRDRIKGAKPRRDALGAEDV